jgi:omega-6 fatty acid desaturase (delta-12 desaturase)
VTATGVLNPRAPWKAQVLPYATPHLGRSWLDVLTSVVPYLGLLVAMYVLLDVSVLLTLALSPLAAGFLLRTFILFHDCTHGSLWRSKRANAWWGRVLGLMLYMPFESWRHSHAVHHATAGDLERRGTGDVPMLTVAEYLERSPRARWLYRLYRHPFVMFGLGPLVSFIVGPRLVPKDARPRVRRAIIRTNIVLAVLVGLACWLIGPLEYLVVQWPAAWLAGSAGIFLFYVQHQFEDAYWETGENWEYADAAIRGSSFFKLPKVLQFFSGNIGYHHVHHLSARIPNYNLQRCHEDLDLFRDVPTLTIRDAIKATRVKLWCEDQQRMVCFGTARAREESARG